MRRVSDAPLVILGCGFTGAAAARLARGAGREVRATLRHEDGADRLRAIGVDVRVTPSLDVDDVRERVGDGADVLVCFPPDGATDARVAPGARRARAVAYVSTTGVYGERTGRIDGATPTDPSTEKARARLDAESRWRDQGAVVLRAAGIYGPWRGLHRRLLRGDFRAPGDGSRVVSRVHVDDLAAVALGALANAPRGGAWPVADATPVPQGDVIAWLCARLGLPLPPSVPLDEAPETLRHDRSVDPSDALRAAGVALRFPSYREGFEHCLAVEASS